MPEFYKKSFVRNIGVFNEQEQEKLNNSTVFKIGHIMGLKYFLFRKIFIEKSLFKKVYSNAFRHNYRLSFIQKD